MSASLTITITEDGDPDGCVEVDWDIDGFDIETARTNGDLPPVLLMGGAMLRLLDDLPAVGGRVAPSERANIPTRHRRD